LTVAVNIEASPEDVTTDYGMTRMGRSLPISFNLTARTSAVFAVKLFPSFLPLPKPMVAREFQRFPENLFLQFPFILVGSAAASAPVRRALASNRS